MDKEQNTTPVEPVVSTTENKLKLNYPQTLKVGIAFGLISLFWAAYDFVIPLLLENAYGLSNTIRGLIMGLDNLLSLFLLPVMGRLSDKSKGKLTSRFGRRTPFIFFGTIAAVVFMVFVPVSAKTQMDSAAETRAFYQSQINDDAFMSATLEGFWEEDNSTKYVDKDYLKNSLEKMGKPTDEASLKAFFTSIRYDEKFESKSGFLGIGGTSYFYDGKALTLQDGKLVDENGSFTNEGGIAYSDIKEGNGYYTSFVEAGMTVMVSEKVQEATFKSRQGISNLALYMVLLLFTLVAMSTFRSPAVALMPDVTPKPLRSQANAIINLCGGIGSALALLVYTIILMFEPITSTHYILIFALCGVLMLALLGLFLWLVKERKLVDKCRQQCEEFGISDEDEEREALEAEKQAEALLEENEKQAEGNKKIKRDPSKDSARYKLFKFYYDKTSLERAKFRSFILILASIFMWFIGYNAVSSSLSVYCTKALLLSPGTASIINAASMAISAIAFIPVGFLAVKIGRKKSIMLGFALAVVSYILLLLVLNPGEKEIVKAVVFAAFYLIAGFGLIIANVNTFPMVVELAKAEDVGKYTGYYYTATMSAQAITPFLAGLVMDGWGMKYLFAYAGVAVAIAIILMIFVKHGDSKQLSSLKKMSKEEKKQVMLDSMGDAD